MAKENNVDKCSDKKDVVNTAPKPTPWYLYIVQNKYNHLYTGISIDWQRRIEEHNSSGPKCAKALKGKGPLSLQYCIQLPNQRIAMQAEIWLKKQSKMNKLAIVNNQKTLPYSHSIVIF